MSGAVSESGAFSVRGQRSPVLVSFVSNAGQLCVAVKSEMQIENAEVESCAQTPPSNICSNAMRVSVCSRANRIHTVLRRTMEITFINI